MLREHPRKIIPRVPRTRQYGPVVNCVLDEWHTHKVPVGFGGIIGQHRSECKNNQICKSERIVTLTNFHMPTTQIVPRHATIVDSGWAQKVS